MEKTKNIKFRKGFNMNEITLFSKQNVISSVKNLIDCLSTSSENIRMNLEDLVSILFRLDEDMLTGYIEYDDWARICDETVFSAGWTNDQLAEAIDKRWGNIKELKSAPQMKGASS